MSLAYICQQLETHNVLTLPSLKGSYLDQFQRVISRVVKPKKNKISFFGLGNTRRRETINLHNIVGYKKGRSKDVIVITAHYDHLGVSRNYKTVSEVRRLLSQKGGGARGVETQTDRSTN